MKNFVKIFEIKIKILKYCELVVRLSHETELFD